MREGTFASGPAAAETKIATCSFRWIERTTGHELVPLICGPHGRAVPSPTTPTRTLQQRFELQGGGEVWHDVPTVGEYRLGGAGGGHTHSLRDAGYSHEHSLGQLSRPERIQKHREYVRRMFNDYSMRDDEIALPPELVATKQERVAELEAKIASTRSRLASLEQHLRDENGGAHA